MSKRIHPHYVKGFNHGYFLAQHHPTLVEKVLYNTNKGSYFEGFENGVSTYREQKKVQSRSQELDNLNQQNKSEKEQER